VAIVTDRSDSIDHGDGAACNAVTTMVEEVLRCRDPFAKFPLARGASQIRISGTADESSPGTPLSLAVLDVPAPPAETKQAGKFGSLELRQRMEEKQRAIAQGEHETQVVELVRRARAACRTGPQHTSPIYSAVRDSVQWLLEKTSAEHSEGLLIVQSDLDESFETELRKVRKQLLGEHAKSVKLEPIKKRFGIDLKGKISVHICGIAQGTDTLQVAARDRVVALWTETLLINAKQLVVRDTCDGYRPSSTSLSRTP
jgi:hypothetical protein